jgi:hypothetical protein
MRCVDVGGGISRDLLPHLMLCFLARKLGFPAQFGCRSIFAAGDSTSRGGRNISLLSRCCTIPLSKVELNYRRLLSGQEHLNGGQSSVSQLVFQF